MSARETPFAVRYLLSSSYGNDSVALIQWAHEQGLRAVTVVYCDTGWASPKWPERVERGEAFAQKCGFHTISQRSVGMEELVRIKKGWPGNAQQFCTAHLKGLPFLEAADRLDADYSAVVMIGKRRAESVARRDTPEFVDASEYHSGRKVWHPLYQHTDAERNALLERAGFEVLPHRSLECNPCVNANRGDIQRLTAGEVARVSRIEVHIGKPMFRPKRFGAVGIYGVREWAFKGRDEGKFEDEESACAGLFGCGL